MSEQPMPVPNDHASIPSLVVEDLGKRSYLGQHRHDVARRVSERQQVGILRYGVPLQPWNGRFALADLDDEIVDAAQYAAQARIELAATDPDHPDLPRLAALYDDLLGMACAVAEMRAAREAGAGADVR